MVPNTAFSQILQLLQIAARVKAAVLPKAISSSAALFMRPVVSYTRNPGKGSGSARLVAGKSPKIVLSFAELLDEC